ncbi:MAG TPA: 23S rRNA (pseudouridine(1915)-N(3))-methyltransferase RlmH, partial [Anaerolineae bacterium]|nr:23S rRNA (pseudouridine(1915)-N(3))-methyltransferase RlmH [Anaerolineae bacterium]
MAKLSGQITVTAVGKIKTKHWRAAQDEYLKRLSRYTTIKLAEVKDAVGRGQPDQAAMAREGEALLKATANARRRIALTPTGKLMSSEAFARFARKEVEEYGRIAFLIGGPLGFAPDVLDQCDAQ